MQQLLGSLLAGYLRLVRRTTDFVIEPDNALEIVGRAAPIIAATWHGQHFMIPFAKRRTMRFAVLVSRHGDGEINAIAAQQLGMHLIRGSGSQRREQISKRGGPQALRSMIAHLGEGNSVFLTADVPKIARVAGGGIVMLAKLSGRPIYPVAVVKRWRITFNSWDRASIGLPFGKGAIVLGAPIQVPRDAGDGQLEEARLAVQAGLDAVHRRAYDLVGVKDPSIGPDDTGARRAEAAQAVASDTA